MGMSLQRIRTIKPEFFVHEELAQLPFVARLLYIGLWTVADREGRLEDRPSRLKALLFPYDAVNVDQLIERLAQRGFVRRYLVEERACIDIPTFRSHQCPNLHEKSSTLPACTETSVQAHACRKNRLGKGTGTGTGTGTGRSIDSLRSSQGDTSPEFDAFWKLYPRKRHKPAALRAWRAVTGEAHLDAILAGVTRWIASAQWQQGYCEDPATFLNQRQWEDEAPAAPTGRTEDTTAQQVARLRARLTQEGT
jgi:hypothetical protein